MKLDVVDIAAYNGVVDATGANLDTLRDNHMASETVDANLWAWFSYQNNAGGTVGIAWVGTVCLSNNNKGYRVSINEYIGGDLNSAEVFAHEIGHNLNMRHDFDPNPGNTRTCATTGETCTGIGSVMDYYQVCIACYSVTHWIF